MLAKIVKFINPGYEKLIDELLEVDWNGYEYIETPHYTVRTDGSIKQNFEPTCLNPNLDKMLTVEIGNIKQIYGCRTLFKLNRRQTLKYIHRFLNKKYTFAAMNLNEQELDEFQEDHPDVLIVYSGDTVMLGTDDVHVYAEMTLKWFEEEKYEADIDITGWNTYTMTTTNNTGTLTVSPPTFTYQISDNLTVSDTGELHYHISTPLKRRKKNDNGSVSSTG